ncbi:MAG: integrase core domain-containing protein [Reichenbachiella sp.]|uniref:integrase core domain-containing protein n=1 Tax=Reichenbachiella sp. TaxID=2184521 RepID=UPI003262F58D
MSMSAKASPHENALAERVNGILKGEYGLDRLLEDQPKAIVKVDQSMASYNLKRPHDSIGGSSPEQKHNEDHWN